MLASSKGNKSVVDVLLRNGSVVNRLDTVSAEVVYLCVDAVDLYMYMYMCNYNLRLIELRRYVIQCRN